MTCDTLKSAKAFTRLTLALLTPIVSQVQCHHSSSWEYSLGANAKATNYSHRQSTRFSRKRGIQFRDSFLLTDASKTDFVNFRHFCVSIGFRVHSIKTHVIAFIASNLLVFVLHECSCYGLVRSKMRILSRTRGQRTGIGYCRDELFFLLLRMTDSKCRGKRLRTKIGCRCAFRTTLPPGSWRASVAQRSTKTIFY